MRSSALILVVTLVLVAGIAAAQQPYSAWSSVPLGTQAPPYAGGPSNPGGHTEALTLWNSRAAFAAAFPGLPTEAFLGTLVGSGAIVSCDPPFNSTTNNACFAPGGIMPGIEIDLVIRDPSSSMQLVVIGTGALGNINVLVGPNTFLDDIIFNFNPAVRAAGFDLVNPLAPGQTYNVEIFGPGGSIGVGTATDGAEGNFWGVDATDVGGITSIVFDGGVDPVRSELTTLVTFGGEPVPVELQSIAIE
jgi:hypothetical protein